MIKSIELGDRIELVTEVRADGSQDKYFSKIEELSDDVITILAPIEAGRIVPLELGRKYGLCVYAAKGLYRCEILVKSRHRDGNMYLIDLEVMSALQKYQRRQYYRLDCMLSFHYKDDALDVWSDGTILDISGGGIRFTSREQLIEKKGVVSHIDVSNNGIEKHLYISGVIIASEPIRGNDSLYENRIEFDVVSNEDRESIIRFIFEEERRRRKNKKGL